MIGLAIRIGNWFKKLIINLVVSPEKKKLAFLQDLEIHVLKITSNLGNLNDKKFSKEVIKNLYENGHEQFREVFSTDELNKIWNILASARMYYWAVWYQEYKNEEMLKLVAEREFKIKTRVFRTNSNEMYINTIFSKKNNSEVLTVEEVGQLNDTILADLVPLEVMISELKTKLGITNQ